MGEDHGRKRLLVTAGLAIALIAAAATATAYAVIRHDRSQLPARPSGIPASITTGQVSLMGLSPVPERLAPGFTLTDQDGRVLPLSAFRGNVVVLEFMDPHCTDICPIVSAEFIDAYRDLGKLAGQVVFAAVNVNQYHTAVADVAAFSRAHLLTSIPGWHFLTGPAARLRAVWNDYNVAVQAPAPASSTPPWSTSSTPAAGNGTSLPRRPTTPPRGPLTCLRTRSPPGDRGSRRSPGSSRPGAPDQRCDADRWVRAVSGYGRGMAGCLMSCAAARTWPPLSAYPPRTCGTSHEAAETVASVAISKYCK